MVPASSSSAADDPPSPPVDGDRFGNLIRLKPEYRERYIALHAHPFPELIEQMRAANLRNYSIFLHEDILFSFYEYVGSDFEADQERIASNPTVQDWWTLTDPMQESLSIANPDEWWASMDELYHGGDKMIASHEADKKAYVSKLKEDASDGVRRVYDEASTALDATVSSAPFQNYTVFLLGNWLYTYFEYAGDRFASDIDQLRTSESLQALRQSLAPLLQDHDGKKEHPTESVFYMR